MICDNLLFNYLTQFYLQIMIDSFNKMTKTDIITDKIQQYTITIQTQNLNINETRPTYSNKALNIISPIELMYKKPTTQPYQSIKKPPSRSSQSQPPSQPTSTRPKYIPPISKDKKNQTVTKESQFKSRDEQLLNMVKEYLSGHGYVRTIQTLRRQKPMTKVGQVNGNNARRRESVSLNNNNLKNQQQQRNILKYFQKGQRQQFFKLTNKWFTSHNTTTSEHTPSITPTSRLQFQLNVYFCTYSVHPLINKSPSIQKPSLQAFRKYLQTRGNQLASQQQYITFFSLPYISKPHQNPSFAALFAKDSITKLKQRLIEFIHEKNSQTVKQSRQTITASQKQKKCCQLEQMYDSYTEGRFSSGLSNQQSKVEEPKSSVKSVKQYQELLAELQATKSRLQQSNEHREYALNYVEKLSSNLKELAQSSKANLLESNKKWFLFAKDIIVMVKKAMKTQGFKIEGFERFEGFFGKSIDEVINNADVSIFDKQSMMVDDCSIIGGEGMGNRSKNVLNDKSALGHNRRQQTSSQLDMVKIQSLFANAEDPQRQLQILLLLKALKNRFSHLKNPFTKRQVIIQYSRHDICGVTPQKYYIQKKLLIDSTPRIREFYLRLTNDIAFDLYGIHYLTKSDKLIENLMNVLRQEVIEETVNKKFVLAILQRFSYPIKSRKKMVQLGIVPLIFKVLAAEQQHKSIYTLQYITAMIMNLSLKKDCQKHFTPYKQQLMSTMIQLMCHQSDQIRNYVNGALYLLLSYKQLLTQAKRQHLQQKIQQMLEEQQHMVTQQGKIVGSQTQEEGQSSLKVQYNYILGKLRGEIEPDSQESDQEQEEGVEMDQFEQQEEQYGEEGDEEEEDDESEYIEGEDECIAGQQLLLKEYTLLGPQALKQQLLTRSVLDETAKRINNTTLSMNRSKRLDNIFVQKQKGSQQLILQPQFDKLLGQQNISVSREDLVVRKKR